MASRDTPGEGEREGGEEDGQGGDSEWREVGLQIGEVESPKT